MQDNLYNLVFERTILSSIINEPILFEELGSILKPDDFYLPAHGSIFLGMSILAQNDKPIDEEFLKHELIVLKVFDEQVMLDILMANPVSKTKAYVDEIVDKSRLRKLLSITNAIKRIAIEELGTSDDVIAEIENQLSKLDSSSNTNMPIDMNEATRRYKSRPRPELIKTGIRELDHILCGGIRKSQLIHIGGDSNVGKTILTKQILKNISNKYPTLFFSYEVEMDDITEQLLNINFNRGNYYITDTAEMGTDISDVSRVIKRMKRKKDIRFVVIDSKMILTHNAFKGFSGPEKIGEIDLILSRLCKSLGIVILMITQISKKDQENGTMSGYNSGLSDYVVDMKILLNFVDGKSDLRRTLKIEKNRQKVMHTPLTLTLNTDTFEFTGTGVVETVYDVGDVPFNGNTVNTSLDLKSAAEDNNDKLDMPKDFL